MGISVSASTVFMPDLVEPYPTLLTFLVTRFPQISEQVWLERITSGKVLSEDRKPVSLTTAYKPNERLFYFREVKEEPNIPFKERLLFSSEHLLVACKPHFLAVTPSGSYVTETLLDRLKKKTGNNLLSPINRIDRGTAGLVLFSARKQTRGLYQQLFMDKKVKKTYQAVVAFPAETKETEWVVENRIEKGEPWFRMQSCEGKSNAKSKITVVKIKGSKALVQLSPITGKKHQLRIHLSEIGLPIVNDPLYPTLQDRRGDDYSLPLQLLSKKIEFRDPITGSDMSFESTRNLHL